MFIFLTQWSIWHDANLPTIPQFCFVCMFGNIVFFVPHKNSSIIWRRPRLCLTWLIPYAFITWCKIAKLLDIELWYLNEINNFFQFLRPVDQLIYSFKIFHVSFTTVTMFIFSICVFLLYWFILILINLMPILIKLF